jgi:hypothetical protein
MRVLSLLVAVVFLLVPASQSQSQQVPSIANRDPQATSIMQQSVAAMLSVDKSTITSVLLSGTVTRQVALEKISGTLSFKWAPNRLCRVDMAFPNYSRSYVANGEQGLEMEDGVTRRMPYHGLMNRPFRYVPAFSEISESLDLSYAITYLGVEALNLQKVHHIHIEQRIDDPNGRIGALVAKATGVDLYVDTQTLLLVRRSQLVSSHLSMNLTLPLDEYFSDYQTTGGLSIPRQITTYVRGQKINEIQITSAVLNTPVNVADFQVSQ